MAKRGGFAADLNLSTLDGSNGFKISGVAAYDVSGCSVSAAGDVNGDGFGDLIIGAYGADPNGKSSGASYVVFGKAGGFAANLNLSTLDGSNGFKINGETAADYSGDSVSAAGDVNGDGFDDLIIVAPVSNASYVVFGSAKWRRDPSVTTVVEPDGDVVKISLVGAKITPNDITLAADGSIESINLTRFADKAAHAKRPLNLTIAVKPAPGGGGDGATNVGFINAEGLDLGKVKIEGNLERIVVGDDLAGRAALRLLKVASLGTSESVPEALATEIRGAAGLINIRGDVNHAAIIANGRVGTLHIGGNLLGDPVAAVQTGAVSDDGDGPVVQVGGGIPFGAMRAPTVGTFSVDGYMDGASVTTNKVNEVAVGGNVQNSTVTAGQVGSVTVGGDFINGSLTSETVIKVVKIFGKLMSNDPEHPVVIVAQARLPETEPARAGAAVAIDKLFVRHGVENALILLGYKKQQPASPNESVSYVPTNPDASVGRVIVRGDWTASSLAVGVLDAGGDGFGRNDTSIDAGPDTAIHARIAKIVIKGQATGSAAEGDFFGITAERIGFAKIAGVVQLLTKRVADDILLDPVNNDFRLVELLGAKPGV